MPRKRKHANAKKPAPEKRYQLSTQQLARMIRSIRWTESYTSLLMGIIVVVVAVLFVVSFLKQTHHTQQTSSISTVATTTPTATLVVKKAEPTDTQVPTKEPGMPTATPAQVPGKATHTYTVQKGDDLWDIAEKYYRSGYNWADIARANGLSDPSMIFSGNKLIIPNVTPQIATVTITPSPKAKAQSKATKEGKSTNAITQNIYTVQKGDDLWDIAVRAYADGYQWTKIARANNLSNPSLIFSGNVLKIPR